MNNSKKGEPIYRCPSCKSIKVKKSDLKCPVCFELLPTDLEPEYYSTKKNPFKKSSGIGCLKVVFGFLFFSFLLIWTAQHNRLLLSFFVLFAPLVSLFLNKLELNKFTKILSIFLFLYSIPYVLFNKSRPLLAEMKFENGSLEFSKPFFLKETRNQLYFIADKFYNNRDLYNRDLYRYYTEVSEKIKSFNCKRIGFDSGNTNIEYPLWAILKNNSHNDKLKIYNVNVKNKSAKIDAENDNLCAIVYVDQVKILN